MRAIAKNALICTTCFGNAYAGDFELKNETDVFEGSRIEGKLIVSRDYDGKAITEKQFPNLETVCGQMNLRGAKYVQVVSLPKLKSMRSAILRRCPDLEIVDLPKLAKFFDSDADGALYLVGLPKLKSVYLPAFKTVGSDWANRSVWLKDCIACVSFELPLLQNIPGELTIENCPALIAVLVPNLHTVLNIIDDDIEFVQGRPGKLTIRNCRALTSVLMPNLHTVQAEFEIANIKDVESVDFSCLKSINGGSYVPEIIISKSKHYAMQQVPSLFCQIQNCSYQL